MVDPHHEHDNDTSSIHKDDGHIHRDHTDSAHDSHHDDTSGFTDKQRIFHGTTKQDSDVGIEEAWSNRVTRTFDEYQHESLVSVRRNRTYVDKVLSDAQQNDNFRQTVANQSLQNAVETANMVGKQAIRQADLVFDRQLNIDEVSQLAAKTGVQQDAMVALLAKAVGEALEKAKK